MSAPNERMQVLCAGLAGLLFGLGLAISGMVNPARVLAFLDVAGAWDPTLAFVMMGALAVTTPGFRFVQGRARPWFGAGFALPDGYSDEATAPLLRPLHIRQ